MISARLRVETMKRVSPDAVRLATLLSLAVRVEPALLRAARSRAGLDAGAESDLWFSDLVASANVAGLSLDPDVAEVLRGELVGDDWLLAETLVDEYHGREPWSIRLEERINLLTMRGDESDEVQRLLQAATLELVSQSREDPDAALGIARWLLAAVGRLPSEARATPDAAAAALAAGVHLDTRLYALDELDDDERRDRLPWLLRNLGTTPLMVRLTRGGVVIGGDAGVPLDVPATEPLVVTVRQEAGDTAEAVEVRVRAGHETFVATLGGDVAIETLDGSGAVLRRAAVGTVLGGECEAFQLSDRWVVTAAEARNVAFDGETRERGLMDVRADRELGVVVAQLDPLGGKGLVIATPPFPEGARWRVGLDPTRPADAAGSLPPQLGAQTVLRVDSFEQLPRPGSPVTLEQPFGAVVAVVTRADPKEVVATAIGLVVERFGLDRVQNVDISGPATDADVFALLLDHGRLPLLNRVEPSMLGLDGTHGYVPRQADAELRSLLQSRDPMVLVAGPAQAGKTRTAYEAARAALPEARIAVPRVAPGVMSRLAHDPAYRNEPDQVLLWIDDAARLIDAGELSSTSVDQLLAREGPTVVLGTITAMPGGASAHPSFGLAREVWLNGSPREELFERLKGMIVDMLGVDVNEITEEASFEEDFDADSLDGIELIMEAEDQLGLTIADEDAFKIQTVGQAVDFALGWLQSPDEPPLESSGQSPLDSA